MRLSLLAIWRGVVGVYNSDDLTFASSIAYYALLSLFPFFLLVFSILGSVTADPADRARDSRVRPPLLPAAVRVRHDADGLAAAVARAARRRRQLADDLGVDGRVRRDHLGGEPRLGRRQAAELPQAQADFVRDARAPRALLLLVGLLLVSAINVVEARWFAVVAVRAPQSRRAAPLRDPLGDDRRLHRGRRADLLFRARTRRSGSATSGSARSSPASRGAARCSASRGTSRT